jgi:hypothetical protein
MAPISTSRICSKLRQCRPCASGAAAGLQASSGATFAVGAAAAEDGFDAQLEAVRSFVHAHGAWLAALAAQPGVEGRVVDIATQVPPPFWASRTFPADLLGLLGGLHIDLCISVYPTQVDDMPETMPKTNA